MTDSRDDRALLRAWADGEQSAGETLVARHVATVHRFFHNKIADAAPELSQRTFLACLEAADRFEGRSSFRTWLLGIAHRQLLRYLRAQHRDAIELDVEEQSIKVLLGRAPTSPTVRLARHDEHQALLAALRALPVQMQILLELRYWEGLTVPAVAEVLELAEGTAASRLHRARARLRDMLEDELGREQAETTIRGLAGWAKGVAEQVPRKKNDV
ncbi:MAG: RNA polymerase sigma factor [Nannocystaceae bacterium]|nr:sigma-70 family RNA polymerase sigma factor [bacterium]